MISGALFTLSSALFFTHFISIWLLQLILEVPTVDQAISEVKHIHSW